MVGIFSVFMWYLLLILYIGQIKGVFGTYEPITYKTGCSLWGIIFIISGVSIIRVARHPSPRLLTCTMVMNILCIIVAVIAVALTVMELSSFESVSYRNYGQAKLGREISHVLLGFYPLELCIAFTYTIFGCVGLMPQSQMDKRKSRKQQEKNDFTCSVTTVTADSSETTEAWRQEDGEFKCWRNKTVKHEFYIL
ncbi:membrane-spanning 4-domains subfamily A member 13 [Neophocaena asiaeorientalis asiaeorientalis]|uniref:Membrane-spanning 4-domains subfamily A member 13 n=1 Tax=Neophocaena asiaeorientalis asiaeorientalis TaxID=1706337 RepID=A0A341BRH6_NEOAA|nr:membrane-spanning 4-domains subfamily A member 13 [Neophocaena asiaeorientalis asiaeorientalis]